MTSSQTLPAIERGRVIAILRGGFGGREEEIAEGALNGGITALEITLNSPGALDSIRRLARAFGSRMAIGAGTVLTSNEVEAAAAAGARFIVSPNTNVTVIQRSKQLGLISIPGCFTPTEILVAIDSGADAVKLFPANSLGPEFVRALRGPLPRVRTIPTGGVTPEMAKLYLDAGAWAIGIGSGLFNPADALAGRLTQISSRARAFVDAMTVKK